LTSNKPAAYYNDKKRAFISRVECFLDPEKDIISCGNLKVKRVVEK